jgi:hypothetical protein
VGVLAVAAGALRQAVEAAAGVRIAFAAGKVRLGVGTASLHEQPFDPQAPKQLLFPVSGEYSVAAKRSEPLRPAAEAVTALSSESTAMRLVKLRKEEIVAGVRKGILEHLREQCVNGRSIARTVSGLESFGAARELLKSLQALKGLKDGVQGGVTHGEASYRLSSLGTAAPLAEEVEASTFQHHRLSVVAVSPGTPELQVGR